MEAVKVPEVSQEQRHTPSFRFEQTAPGWAVCLSCGCLITARMSALKLVGLIFGVAVAVVLIKAFVVLLFAGGPFVWLLLGVAGLAAIVWVAW